MPPSMFVLFNILISIVLSIVERVTGLYSVDNGVGFLTSIYSLAILIPSISVGVRRLHDTGKSGWWILLNLVPFIGWLVLIAFYVTDSDAGSNKYGPNPKLVSSIAPIPVV